MKSLIFLLPAALAALFLSSCAAPNFQKQYAQAVAETGPPYDDVTGPWEGTWISGHNQHTGELKAIISEAPGENRYRFLYWATWGGMKGTFKFIGDGKADGDAVQMTGAKRLGPLKYNHKARLTPTTFEATYGSDAKDFGEFELSRPE